MAFFFDATITGACVRDAWCLGLRITYKTSLMIILLIVISTVLFRVILIRGEMLLKISVHENLLEMKMVQ